MVGDVDVGKGGVLFVASGGRGVPGRGAGGGVGAGDFGAVEVGHIAVVVFHAEAELGDFFQGGKLEGDADVDAVGIVIHGGFDVEVDEGFVSGGSFVADAGGAGEPGGVDEVVAAPDSVDGIMAGTKALTGAFSGTRLRTTGSEAGVVKVRSEVHAVPAELVALMRT